ncbi:MULTISPECIES: hypothetical protein [Deinococcus]|uniref:Uncharacterized protein n=1 Tax=Deinococcus rufus TaxID=2136097 RepID=A0ABV7Z8D6_9DEIO|nr:hypothetical protein [Deinococcus sp. AB2017081]WQE94554.1 hypothetical protein U2P90_14230 [Deinococcus sp. AB2017081]
MKPLSGVAVGLSILLTACPASPAPVPMSRLDVKISGVASAPVVITDSITSAVVFDGTIEGSKTFEALAAGRALRVDGHPVVGYNTPEPQYVTVTSTTAVTLTYTLTPAPVPKPPIGNVRGTVRLSLGTPPAPDSGAVGWTVFYGYSTRGAFQVSPGTVNTQLGFDMVLNEDAGIASAGVGTVVDALTLGCTVTARAISDPAARISPIGAQNDGAFSLYTPGAAELPLYAVVSETDRTRTELVYADRPVTATVKAQCSGAAVTVNLQLTRGWNVVAHGSGHGVAGQVNLTSSGMSPLNLLLIP